MPYSSSSGNAAAEAAAAEVNYRGARRTQGEKAEAQ